MNIEFSNRLVQLRKERGYSQESLALALNISRQAISKWERGEASPDTDNLIALAMLYNVSLDALVGFSLPEDEGGEENIDSVDEASEEALNSETAQPEAEPLPEQDEAEETEAEKIAEEAPTEQGFSIENDEYSVYISNGVLTVTPKPKEKKTFLSRLFGRFAKKVNDGGQRYERE